LRALLDTHVLLWFLAADDRLPPRWREVLENRADELYFSAVSVAEISLKYASGKLKLPDAPARLIPEIIADRLLITLPLTIAHALGVSTLPVNHKDPFDRLLIAQARAESLPLITSDGQLSRYGAQILW
jgi:PIN domain nuclease of toxin-antitoxin system